MKLSLGAGASKAHRPLRWLENHHEAHRNKIYGHQIQGEGLSARRRDDPAGENKDGGRRPNHSG